eukprot:GILJ01010903.1.p1 GENE.GILJ01010903.1~~GILJ01010903.1.p1  ORF type:complete len:318 (-),score=45.72 GILJ01010903.1:34-987(-)
MSSSSNEKRTSLGRKPGAKTWTKKLMTVMLDVIELKRPIGNEQWQEVLSLYASTSGDSSRTVESIRRKWNQLCSTKKKTDDPDCPPLIARAKRLYWKINGMVCSEVMGNENHTDDGLNEEAPPSQENNAGDEQAAAAEAAEGSSVDSVELQRPSSSLTQSESQSSAEGATATVTVSLRADSPDIVVAHKTSTKRTMQESSPGPQSVSTMTVRLTLDLLKGPTESLVKRRRINQMLTEHAAESENARQDFMYFLMLQKQRREEERQRRVAEEREWREQCRRERQEEEERREERLLLLMRTLFNQQQQRQANYDSMRNK